ncbi:MAG: TlpA family protein disulfide reductase [Proteobacteria bacterium]|nr:TlpA family protein disulfide reductase [Pseudomonadota bacterium]
MRAAWSLDGRRAGLGEFLAKDKWTLVMVWTTYCGACRKQYPLISEFHGKHKDKDATVLGVSLDGYGQGEKVKAYQAAHQQNFPSVLADPDDFIDKYQRTTGEKFTGTPTYLLYDAKGALRAYIDGLVSVADIEGYIGRPK